jgi:hypothetical protein
MIIFTSNHGDYLGDRYALGKELFYDQPCHVPFLIYDPSKIKNMLFEHHVKFTDRRRLNYRFGR